MYELLIGLWGMLFILIAFMLNVFKVLDSHAKTFLWFNLLGSVLLVWYALLLGSVPFLILNCVWSVVALWGLMHHSPQMRRQHGGR